MKGTIEDIKNTRRMVAVEGKKGKPLPPSRDVEVVASATRPGGLGPGQMEQPE